MVVVGVHTHIERLASEGPLPLNEENLPRDLTETRDLLVKGVVAIPFNEVPSMAPVNGWGGFPMVSGLLLPVTGIQEMVAVPLPIEILPGMEMRTTTEMITPTTTTTAATAATIHRPVRAVVASSGGGDVIEGLAVGWAPGFGTSSD